MPIVQSEVSKSVDAADMPVFFRAAAIVWRFHTPSANLVRRPVAAHQAGVYWIQAPAGTSSLRDSVELSEQRAALRLNLTLT